MQARRHASYLSQSTKPHLSVPSAISLPHALNMSSDGNDNSSLAPSNCSVSSENRVYESLKAHLALTPFSALLTRTPQRSSCAASPSGETGGADGSSVMSRDGTQTAASGERWYYEVYVEPFY
jgi:hypothetical protein